MLSPDIFDHLADLRELHLNNTQITDLPEYIFDNIKNLRSLYIGGNPELKYIHESTLHYLKTSKIKIYKSCYSELFNINTLEPYNDDHGCKGMMN